MTLDILIRDFSSLYIAVFRFLVKALAEPGRMKNSMVCVIWLAVLFQLFWLLKAKVCSLLYNLIVFLIMITILLSDQINLAALIEIINVFNEAVLISMWQLFKKIIKDGFNKSDFFVLMI